MIWLWVVAVLVIFILGWEFLALVTRQERMPTWSRLIRSIWQQGRPELRPVIFVVTLTVGFAVVIWMAIHFIVPEGWWDEFLFLFEDFCVTIGIPC